MEKVPIDPKITVDIRPIIGRLQSVSAEVLVEVKDFEAGKRFRHIYLAGELVKKQIQKKTAEKPTMHSLRSR
jgi:hypothetical protein